jgi:PleD family two-component response regulator
VASFPADADALGLLVKRADDAMYAAKGAGRDSVVVWSDASRLCSHETGRDRGR